MSAQFWNIGGADRAAVRVKAASAEFEVALAHAPKSVLTKKHRES